MTIKDFLHLVRESQEVHVITDPDGEPEFVVLPYARYRALLGAESLDERAQRTVREALSEKKAGQEYWDAMMEEVSREEKGEKEEEEPKFQFEPVEGEGS